MSHTSVSLAKGSTLAHTQATRHTFSGEIVGNKYGVSQTGLNTMASPDMNGTGLKRVSTADGAARPRMHSLHDDADKMNKTAAGLSI